MRDVLADIKQVHQIMGAGGELDSKRVAIIQIKIQKCPYDHNVEWEPNRAAPVGVSAEHCTIRFAGHIANSVLVAMHLENVRMISVIAGQGSNPVRAEEFVFVEQLFKNTFQSYRIHKRENAAIGDAEMVRARGMHRFLERGKESETLDKLTHKHWKLLSVIFFDDRGRA